MFTGWFTAPRSARVCLTWLLVGALLLVGGGFRCRAQHLRYLSQQSWSTEQGLPQSSVHSITQTSDGYLWIATEAGLARFDGVNFRIFNRGNNAAFRSDDICCLLAGSGGLWVGTEDGLLLMRHGRFQRFGQADGLPSSSIDSLAMAGTGHGSSQLVVNTDGGWAGLEQGRFHALTQPPTSLSSEITEANTSRDAVTAPGKSPSAVPGAGPSPGQWSFSPTEVAVDYSGGHRVWRIGHELSFGRIQAVTVDREGLAWVGMNHGLFVLHADQKAALPVTLLGANSVLSIFEDAEGDHWIGTETSGLHVLRWSAFRSEAALDGQAVTSVVQTRDGDIWIGTRDDGLRRVQHGNVNQPTPQNSLTSAFILCMAPAVNGGLWVGTPDGLNFIDPSGRVRQITSADGLPDDDVRALAAASDGSVWIGTRQGLAHLRMVGSQQKVTTLSSANGLGGDMIGALLLRSGDLWAATSGGLSVIQGNGRIRNFTTRDGLGANIVTSLAQDSEDHLWVGGSNGGLSIFQAGRFLPVSGFLRSAASDGDVEGITPDQLGFLWFRMDRGILRIAVNQLMHCIGRLPCTLHQEQFGLADGLPNDEVVAGEPSIGWLTDHGEIWFPTRGGVAIVDTQHLPQDTVAPPVVLQKFTVDDVSEPLSQASARPGESSAALLRIPFGHARFTVVYSGLSFTAPSEVRYRFRLQGFDKQWTEAGNRRSATYTNLPPGVYLFRVQAMNKDGVWNRAGAQLSFRIVPPLYRRGWFLLLCLLAVLALLAGIYLLRLQRLQGEFNAVLAERNRIAREIHDTLTQDFVGASLQLDLIAQHLNRGKVELALEQVKRTRQFVSEGLEEARRSIWEMRADTSQHNLPMRLTRLVQRDAFSTLNPRLHIGGAYRSLEPRVEREVLRIAQEALNNVLHHASSSEVSVELHYSSDMLVLTIEDTGVGFDLKQAARKAAHFGLLGMKERAATISAELEISSEPGHGAKVCLRVPIVQSAG
ncbi:MAG: sensor histidine kinase [Acidobacteriaceae bacterium]